MEYEMSLIKDGVWDADILKNRVVEKYMILEIEDKKTLGCAQCRSRLPRCLSQGTDRKKDSICMDCAVLNKTERFNRLLCGKDKRALNDFTDEHLQEYKINYDKRKKNRRYLQRESFG